MFKQKQPIKENYPATEAVPSRLHFSNPVMERQTQDYKERGR